MHQQTLRMYEAKGLVRPQRTPGGTRRYSEADLERLRLIQRLTTELGLNLAGVEHVLRLEDELGGRAPRRAARARAARRDPEVHRRYKRELVLYQPPAGAPRNEELMDFNKLTIKIAGGGRGGAGARAPPGNPETTRSICCSRCSSRSCRLSSCPTAGAP